MADYTRNNNFVDLGRETPDNPLAERLARPEPPLHLPYAVRRFWKKTLASLPADWFITADMHLFEMYCITYLEYHEFSHNAKTEGRVYMDDKGVLRKNPWQEMSDKAKYTLMVMTSKLKFTPKSRENDRASKADESAKKEKAKQDTGRRSGLTFIAGGKES